MSSKFWAGLSSDYEKLFETEIGYDVIIYAGEEQYVKEIHAHSNILSIRSQYFRSAFSNEWAEKKDGKFIFKKPNISPQLFNIILRFFYCGNIELKNLQGATIWVAKIKNSLQLIGGYNPLDWDVSWAWKTTADSFLFNFPNGKNTYAARVSYVNSSQLAVFCGDSHGPTMGNLTCYNNNWCYNNYDSGNRYSKIGIPTNFEVEDYEVFKVIKK
ncbi:unnamed protein product [Rhizophagus irregularis]|nr:unnamed protein product [Rhizophagus irregularis]